MSTYRARMKERLSTPALTEAEQKNYREYFTNNVQFAKSIRNKSLSKGDPILQRADDYIPKSKKVQSCNSKYFDLMKQHAQVKYSCKSRALNKDNVPITINQESKDPVTKLHKKMIARSKSENKVRINEKIRTYPETYLKSAMEDIIHRQNIYPVPKERYHIIVKEEYKKPSEEYVRMNNRGILLPCELYDHSKKANRASGQRYKNNFSFFRDTKDNLFSTNKNNKVNPTYRLLHKDVANSNYDHIDGLISYEYGPKFKYKEVTDKPTRSSYNTICAHNYENLKENYVIQKCGS